MIRDPEMLEQLLETIRNFVKNELVPLEHEVEESNAIPEHSSERRSWFPRAFFIIKNFSNNSGLI